MDLQDGIVLFVGIALGWYVVAHYAKSGKMV
jgi:hypothetical protein